MMWDLLVWSGMSGILQFVYKDWAVGGLGGQCLCVEKLRTLKSRVGAEVTNYFATLFFRHRGVFPGFRGRG